MEREGGEGSRRARATHAEPVVRMFGRPALVGPDGTTELRGGRESALLSLLVLRRGRWVSRAALEDELWAGARVSPSALRVGVTRLRQRMAAAGLADAITSGPAGYSLDLAPSAVDVERFAAGAADVRSAAAAGDARALVTAAQRADRLWAGEPFAGLADIPAVDAERHHLAAVRRDLLDHWSAALLAVGAPADVDDLLRETLAADPYRERTWMLRVAGVYAEGRRSDAVALLDRAVESLRDGLGAVPHPALLALRRDILAGDDHVRVVAGVLDGVGMLRGTAGPARLTGPAVLVDPGRRAARTRARLVGRDELVAHAGSIAGASRSSVGDRVWIIEGEAGAGKTCIATELAAMAEEGGLHVSWGVCVPDVGAALAPVAQIASSLVRDPGVPAHERGALAAEVALLLGEGGSPHDVRAVAGMVREAPAARARLEAALSAVGEGASGVVVVDDVQWASDSAADLLLCLLRASPATHWLLLTRDRERSAGAERLLAEVARMGARWDALSPLGTDDATALAERHLPSGGAALVVARGRGNPFFIVELARHLAAGGAPGDLPRTVDVVLGHELDRLDPGARELVDAVALAGSTVPLASLGEVVLQDPVDLAQGLRRLDEAGLVTTDASGRHAVVAHDLILDAVVGRIAAPEAAGIHRRAARALAGGGPGDEVARLRHLLGAGDADVEAIEETVAPVFAHLLALGSHDEVIALGREVTARLGIEARSSDGVRARLSLAAAHRARGEPTSAEAVLAAQAPVLTTLADPVLDAEALLIDPPVMLGRDRAGAWLDDARPVLVRLPATATPQRIELLVGIGHALVHVGALAEARATLDEAAADDHTDPILDALVETLRLRLAFAVDAPSDATVAPRRNLTRLALRTGDETMRAILLGADLEQAMRTSGPDDVAEAIAAASDVAVAGGEVEWYLAAARAGHLLMAGDLEAAEVASAAALSLGASRGIGISLSVFLGQQATSMLHKGTLGALHATVPEVIDASDPPVLAMWAHVCLHAGDLAGARARAEALVRPGLLTSATPEAWPMVAAVAAPLAQTFGLAALAEELDGPLQPHAGSGLTIVGMCYLGPVDLVRGQARAALGDVEGARALLAAADLREERLGIPSWRGQIAAAVARLDA